MRDIRKIILHDTGGRIGNTPCLVGVGDHAYGLVHGRPHFFVGNDSILTGDGKVFRGRAIETPGSYGDSVDVYLVGRFNRQHPSEKQMRTLYGLLFDICREYKLKGEDIYRHKMGCVGKMVDLEGIRRDVDERLQVSSIIEDARRKRDEI